MLHIETNIIIDITSLKSYVTIAHLQILVSQTFLVFLNSILVLESDVLEL